MADLYHSTKRLEKVRARIEDHYPGEDAELLLEWSDHRLAEGKSPATMYKYLNLWTTLKAGIDFPLEFAREDQLEELVRKINSSTLNEKDYGPNTRSQMKIALRLFYQWLGQEEKVEFIESGVKKSEETVWRKSDFVEPEDVKKLIEAADKKRDKALLQLLWATGGRIGEVLPLEWADLEYRGELVNVRFRHSKSRKRVVPVQEAAVSFLEHINGKDTDVTGFVFKSEEEDDRIGYHRALHIVKDADKKSGVGKGLTPHDFRRGRATYLASQGWNKYKLCKYFGWSKGSRAPERYIWLAESDIEDAVTELPEE